MSDSIEHAADIELNGIEHLVQVPSAQEDENEHASRQLDKTSAVVLVAYNLKTGEELYERQFEVNHAKRILAMQNSGWKQHVTIS